jgi:small-conductance mechanosensitive channel
MKSILDDLISDLINNIHKNLLKDKNDNKIKKITNYLILSITDKLKPFLITIIVIIIILLFILFIQFSILLSTKSHLV